MRLRGSGHEALVVGGTLRDLLLAATPKDFDVLTSAEPHQVAQMFPRAYVLGRSFPICHVHSTGGEIIEVSSYSTNADPSRIPLDAAASVMMGKRRETERKKMMMSHPHRHNHLHAKGGERRVSGQRSKKNGRREEKDEEEEDYDDDEGNKVPGRSTTCTWAIARKENAQKRDFTVNGLLYDPFSRILFDYVGGVQDCTTRTLRTINPSPAASFAHDPARILRAVRLAARARLTIEKTTAQAMTASRALLCTLPHGRLHMELSAMMSHGAARPSVLLLWRFGILDMMLPQLAVLCSKETVPRRLSEGDQTANVHVIKVGEYTGMFLHLLRRMDEGASFERPADSSVWVGVLAAPLIARACRRVQMKRARKWREVLGGEEGGQGEDDEEGEEEEEEGEGAVAENATATATATTSTKPHEHSNTSSNGGGAEYINAYAKVIDRVLHRLLSPLDAKSRRYLESVQKSIGDSTTDNAPDLMVVPMSLFPRQAVEQAREFFLLEATLRSEAKEEDPTTSLHTEATTTTTRSMSTTSTRSTSTRRKSTSSRKFPRRRRSQRTGLTDDEETFLELLRSPEIQWREATSF